MKIKCGFATGAMLAVGLVISFSVLSSCGGQDNGSQNGKDAAAADADGDSDADGDADLDADTDGDGDNDADALAGFNGSACKSHSVKGSGRSTVALAPGNAELDGLQCISWTSQGNGSFLFDLVNFPGACGAEWSGKATTAPGVLDLLIENPDCLLADCGICTYDWSFDLKGISTSGALTLNITVDECPGHMDPKKETVTIAADRLSKGILCRYLGFDALAWISRCGGMNLLCNNSQYGMCSGQGPECDAGLTCSDKAGTEKPICLEPCGADAGTCPLPDLLTCQNGFCLLKETW